MKSDLLFTFGVAAFASIGTFLYGFDTGILTTTIAHDSWQEYMDHPSDAVTGACVSGYIGGEAVGSIIQILIADKLGRLRFMEFAALLVTVGCIIQTAAQNIPMFISGRVVAGVAVGAMSGTVPVYLSEISSPKTRGLVGGLGGVGLSLGTMTANWVGFACGYASYGAVQWRLPLAIQIPWGLVLFTGLVTFMPNSPRQLIRNGKVEEALRVFTKIRSDLHSRAVQEEFSLMKGQIEFEMEREIPSYGEIFRIYRHRALVCIGVQILTSVTGVNVIQYYQTNLYSSLGMEGQLVLALAAVFGTCAFISNAIFVFILPDRLGRRKMLLVGCAWVVVTEIYAAVMQREFENTDNRIGKGFAIAGLYVFIVGYYALINSVTWLYGAEVVPYMIRSKMVGLSAVCHYVVNVALTQAGPSAFTNIQENYYYVFVSCCTIYFVLIYFYFPETNQRTLEEIAAAFGDEVVDVEESQLAAAGLALETKAGVERVEEL